MRKLYIIYILCFIFFLVEVVGGILAGSLMALSYAAHMSADLSAFIIAIMGYRIISLPALASYTSGVK
jgi:zinc transporter 2